MQKYALLGWPVKHSVSPQMQGAAFASLDIAASYDLVEVAPADLPSVISRLRDAGYRGWNVTVPHKEDVFGLVDELDPGAAAAGSVNTVVNDAGRLHGYSTDGYGLATAVYESFGVSVAGARFVFVGAGGAALATSVHFARMGAREVILINRTLEKARRIAAAIRSHAPECRTDCAALADIGRVEQLMRNAQVLIQATSLGLHGDDPVPLPPELIPEGIDVLDMIYRATPLLRAAAQRNCRTADGRGMLLHQGARSFELWTGSKAPVEVMRRALDQALAARQHS